MKDYHAELKIYNLHKMSDADISRLVIWLQEISRRVDKEKNQVSTPYTLKLMK